MKDFINKSIRITLLTAFTVGVLANCEKKKDDNTLLLAALFLANQGIAGSALCDGVGVPAPTLVLEGTINVPITVSGSALLKGTVNVTNGGSLTVTPGSVIFGDTGSSLFIYEGGTLTAVGTANRPICFTSSQAVGGRAPGNWGGIVAIGNGTVSSGSQLTEGTTPRTYPGTQNSTINLKYVVIEFAGNEVVANNELNGVSSYAVTASTSNYDYVQIHRGLDDAFEWWGGDVNGSHLLVTGGQDDDFDIDEGFTGTLTHIIGVKYPTSCGGTASGDPHGFEMDGSSNGTASSGNSNPNISNFTSIGQSVANGEGMRLREGMRGSFSKGLVYGYQTVNFNCVSNGGNPVATSPVAWTDVKGQSGKSATTCGSLVNNTELTALPIATLGNITDCGVGETVPDFTTPYGDGSLGGGSVAEGKWWTGGWTVYRSK